MHDACARLCALQFGKLLQVLPMCFCQAQAHWVHVTAVTPLHLLHLPTGECATLQLHSCIIAVFNADHHESLLGLLAIHCLIYLVQGRDVGGLGLLGPVTQYISRMQV